MSIAHHIRLTKLISYICTNTLLKTSLVHTTFQDSTVRLVPLLGNSFDTYSEFNSFYGWSHTSSVCQLKRRLADREVVGKLLTIYWRCFQDHDQASLRQHQIAIWEREKNEKICSTDFNFLRSIFSVFRTRGVTYLMSYRFKTFLHCNLVA